jgi:Ca2+-binding EF-hand superfamily protein
MNRRSSVKKSVAALLMGIFIISTAALCGADEQKDHVCFRIIDSNKDGKVTIQEFEKFFADDEDKFNNADLDKDGTLSHDEYHAILGHGSS